jgi:hypothetical protein
MDGVRPPPARPGLRPAFGGSAFARGAGARGALGALIALGALGLAWGIEQVRQTAAARSAVATAVDGAGAAPAHAAIIPEHHASAAASADWRTLRMESTFPATWTVSCDGEPLAARAADSSQWLGQIPDQEVVVTATPENAGDGYLHGLRIEAGLDLGPVWGNGAVTAIIPARTARRP